MRLNRALADRIAKQMARGDTLEMICFRERLSRSTLYDWRRGKFPQAANLELREYFRTSIEQAEIRLLERLRRQVEDARSDPETAHKAAWILIRRFPTVAKDLDLSVIVEIGFPDQVVTASMATLDKIETELEAECQPLGQMTSCSRRVARLEAAKTEPEDLQFAFTDDDLAALLGDDDGITFDDFDDSELQLEDDCT